MANLPSNLGYAANVSPMMQPIQPQLQIPQQMYLPNYQPTLEMSSSSNYQNQLELNQPTNQSYEPFLEQENAIQKDVKTKVIFFFEPYFRDKKELHEKNPNRLHQFLTLC